MLDAVIIVDNFLSDPLSIRELAISLDFNVVGNFPGARSEPHDLPVMREMIQGYLPDMISAWPDDGFNCTYQLTSSGDRTWVHADDIENYAGILFLTPGAPLWGGLTLYRHRVTGFCEYSDDFCKEVNRDAYDRAKWMPTDLIGNAFNRLVLFPGRRFHAASAFFGGPERETMRLTQTFFFSVANCKLT